MPASLAQLEQQKRDLLSAFSQLGDLRPGSLSAVARRCGKPNCRCAQPDHPGHGPQQRGPAAGFAQVDGRHASLGVGRQLAAAVLDQRHGVLFRMRRTADQQAGQQQAA